MNMLKEFFSVDDNGTDKLTEDHGEGHYFYHSPQRGDLTD